MFGIQSLSCCLEGSLYCLESGLYHIIKKAIDVRGSDGDLCNGCVRYQMKAAYIIHTS